MQTSPSRLEREGGGGGAMRFRLRGSIEGFRFGVFEFRVLGAPVWGPRWEDWDFTCKFPENMGAMEGIPMKNHPGNSLGAHQVCFTVRLFLLFLKKSAII